MDLMKELIIVLDYGTPGSHTIARRIRGAGVFCRVLPSSASPADVAGHGPRGVVLAGSPRPETPAASSSAQQHLPPIPPADAFDVPVLDLRSGPPAEGDDAIQKFLFETCRCRPTWTMENYAEEAVAHIRRQIGDGRAVVGLSGGVDSAVAAALVHRAAGKRLTPILVDHGLLRHGEADQVASAFRELGLPPVVVNAEETFFADLAGITDPEEKRRRIGTRFIDIFEEEARRLGPVDFLVQGTLYSDVLESGGEGGETIKTHHNVGGLPETMQLQLLEPLRMLFKDEVRSLGAVLGLPEEVIWRHPFPGPGLAIRIMGEVTPERAAIARQADTILLEEIRQADLYGKMLQCFAVLTDTRSVGAAHGERTFGYAVAVRAVTGDDGLISDWVRVPFPVLARISDRIMAEVPGVSRVVYDITRKPPGTIEWE